MRGPSHHLFDLIKSLNRREKGYVFGRLQEMEGGGKSNNCTLFKAVDRLERPSETALLHLLDGHPLTGYLPRAKSYLHQSILKILRDYHANKNQELKRLRDLENVVVLYHLGLVGQAKKQLERFRKGAEELPAYLQMGALYQELLLMLFTNVLEEGKGMRERVDNLVERVGQEGRFMDGLARLQGLLFDRKMGAGPAQIESELQKVDLGGVARSDFAFDIAQRGLTLKAYFEGDDPAFERFTRDRLERLRGSRLYDMYPILQLNAINNRLDYLFLNARDSDEVATLLTALENIRSSRFVEARVQFRSLLFRCKFMLVEEDFTSLSKVDADFLALGTDLHELSFSAEQGTINVLLGICFACQGDYRLSGDRLKQVYHDRDIGPVLYAICLTHLFLNALVEEKLDLAELYLNGLHSRSLRKKIPLLTALSQQVFRPLLVEKAAWSDYLIRLQQLKAQTADYASRAYLEEGHFFLRLRD